MEKEEKILSDIIEVQNSQKLDYILHIGEKDFLLENSILLRSSTPVTRPTTRGGVYFSDKYEFKIKAQVNDLSIVPLLSQSMLGPNTEFQDLKITTKIQLDNSIQEVTFVVNLTNSMQSSSHVELNMTIVKVNMETKS